MFVSFVRFPSEQINHHLLPIPERENLFFVHFFYQRKTQTSSNKHPRAAYQFGVKTSGGRKTRKNVNAANERKIDRELDKINKILEKGVNKNVRF